MVHAPALPADRLRSAIALRLCGAFFATSLGICVHGAAAHASTGQIVLMRAGLSLPWLILWAAMTAPVAAWLPRAPAKHLMRGLAGGLTMMLNFYALGQLPVAHAQTLSYLAPVLSVPLAVILLGERLSVRAVISVALGFVGMLAMLYTSIARPDWGWSELSGMIAGIASAGIMAWVRVHIRAMTATETTISIALSFAVVATVIGALATLMTGWTPMTPVLWAWLGGAGLLGAATHITATEASARAPVGVLAPFDYAGLVFAVALDFALFAHLPGPWGWLGILLIAAGGLATIRRPRPEGAFLRLK
ncbi:DMT family transporter [Jannaschia sp. S6380]|uniref:DMT family transporter n=1 Tax=Jannaschia sp. S6380 TaxID=2926408 RepID=UPI001FF30191|nr:DMT family transporter [Jannaschia sp. S6380]MCK0168620.1 DMT family transporter [Jannaschia sp. S6380]